MVKSVKKIEKTRDKISISQMSKRIREITQDSGTNGS